MIFNETTIAGGVEILASKDFQAIPIKVAGNNVVKAGTPLTAAGASTTGANAVGVLLYDVDPTKNPNGAAVVHGIIDATKAQAHSSVTYVDALYTALPGVVFRTNIGVNAGE